MGYDPNSDLTAWSYLGPSTGVTTTTVNLAYNYGYDAAQQVSGLTLTDNGVAQTQPVTHDAAGRMTGWGSPNGPNTWGFDGDGDVISTTSFINAALRTTVFTYSTTLPQELLQQHTDTLGVDTYSYDGNGNVVSEVSTDPITSPYYVNQHVAYDALERPVTVSNVLNGAVVTATLGYNPAGQNITYTAVMSGQVIDANQYRYDAAGTLVQTIATTATLNPDGSIQSSGAYTDSYAYDPLGQPLFLLRQQNGTTQGYTYLTDGHDSVVGLADSSGQRVDRYQYAPYGAPTGLGFWETVPQLFRNDGTVAEPGLGLIDPGGDFKNIGSGTTILANKSGGYFSYFAFGDDPFDVVPYEAGPGVACLIGLLFRRISSCQTLPPISICHTLRECVDVIGEASSIGAMALVFVPGAEPIAGVLGGTALAANLAGTALDAIDFAFNPRARTTGKAVGLFLDLASIVFSKGGEKLIDYAVVSDKEEALNAAKARGAPEAVIERFEQETRDAKLLSKKIASAIFEPKSTAIDLANQRLGASLENDSAIVTGPDQPTVATPASPGQGVVSGRLYLYIQMNK